MLVDDSSIVGRHDELGYVLLLEVELHAVDVSFIGDGLAVGSCGGRGHTITCLE